MRPADSVCAARKHLLLGGKNIFLQFILGGNNIFLQIDFTIANL